jgi:hypothetical protein
MSCDNVNVGNGQLITIGGNNVDAFGRLRVSNPLTIFDSKSIMSKNTLFDESTANGGSVTYTSNKSTVNLNVTEAAGSKTIRQSKRVMSYQPGKSLLIFNTFVMNTLTANLKQKVGLFDANNGIFFTADGTTLKIVRRTYTSGAAVDTEISQSSWNGDKLNGTGSSGFTLDPATSNIATIRIKTSRPYAVIVPAGIDVLNISNGDFEWGLFVNAAPSSPFSYSSFSDNVEYDLTTSDLTSTGTRIAGGYLGGKTAPFALGGDFIAFSNQLGQTIAGVSDTLTLGVRPGTANGDVSGLLKWYDLT